MNDSEIFLLCLVVVSIFLIWRSVSQKKKKKVSIKIAPQTQLRRATTVNAKSHDCIPPRGTRIGVVVGTISSSATADGQSTLKALQESLLWSRKNIFEKETGLSVEEVVKKLRPSITPFVWEYHT